MAPITNGRQIFNQIPTEYPEPGKTTLYDLSQTIDLDTAPLKGGFLVKTLVLSMDPYHRGMMRPATEKSYIDPFIIGEPMYGYGIGIVLRSETPDVKQGDHVYGQLLWQEYSVFDKFEGFQIVQNDGKLPWSVYIGVLGMPGQTAYMGWAEYSKAKKGETVFVSGGAGVVGSLVIQFAKRQGLKVISSAGSDEKVKFLKSIGTDVAFNYKTTGTREILEKEGPINIYWDNVGGETLEAALDASAVGGRVIVCGLISGYNETAKPIRNIFNVLKKALTVQGFIVFHLFPKYTKEFYEKVPSMIANGELKYWEDVRKGLDKVGEALRDVQTGGNVGKCVIWLADG